MVVLRHFFIPCKDFENYFRKDTVRDLKKGFINISVTYYHLARKSYNNALQI